MNIQNQLFRSVTEKSAITTWEYRNERSKSQTYCKKLLFYLILNLKTVNCRTESQFKWKVQKTRLNNVICYKMCASSASFCRGEKAKASELWTTLYGLIHYSFKFMRGVPWEWDVYGGCGECGKRRDRRSGRRPRVEISIAQAATARVTMHARRRTA